MAYVFSQNELQYVYNSAKERCEAHPEIVEKYKKLLADVPVYKDRNESIRKAVSASKESNKNGQVWAKIGKDEEYFYIQDYYIASADWRVWQAAEYIGMEQIFVTF